MSPSPLRCAAVVACRNDAVMLERHLPLWIAEGLEVVVIDHSSDDNTRAVAERWLGQGVLAVEHLDWQGTFSLSQQLSAKATVIEGLEHDWIIHLDADEWLHSPRDGETLQQAISRLAAGGANAVNFEEFVFLPLGPGLSADHYYFFAPAPQRLIRAWKHRCGFSNQTSGGHRLMGEGETALQVAPENLVLRHRIVHNQRQARRKYLERRFEAAELQQGWHHNRRRLSARQLTFPDPAELQQLHRTDQRQLERIHPHSQHYWHWADATKTQPCRHVVCLYGCNADAGLLDAFYDSALWALIRERPDTLLLEVWAGATEQTTFDGRRLTLATPEDYGQLSLKSLEMLRWCSRQLRMKQLIKIDLTCVDYQGHQHIKLNAVTAWLKQRIDEPLAGSNHYDGFLRHNAPSHDNLHQWAQRKGVSVDPVQVFGKSGAIPGFYSGKAYALSRPLLRYIAGYGTAMAHEHVQHLHGAEDLMVGRLAEQFHSNMTQSARKS